MRRIIAILCALWLLAAIAVAANPSANAEAAIRQVLDRQVEAWNRQDLDAFMQGYWHSPQLTFFSGATEHHGWDAALERYRKAYQSEGRQMGKLGFSDLQIEILSPAAAFVRGSFHLSMPEGKQPHGIFTLVFRKFPAGWRIIHDHTCAAE
ncbi:MAG TPA: nuclear transport factor 2 family protein [Terriglobales bacterium]|nr:nuclear transport factor 2 family protein [Terriglobales bacterium]